MDPVGPTTFSLATPGILNSIADQSALNLLTGGTWANGTWYGLTDDPYLVTINPVTGARTVIGSTGVNLYGLSFNSTNGIMYGLDGNYLYTVDVTTGLATLVTGYYNNTVMVSLAINSEGEAYALDLYGTLGSVNLTTGVFTSIGPFGFNVGYYHQDMEFDRDSDELYVTVLDAAAIGWLGVANTTTGHVYKIADFEGGAQITGFAIPYGILCTTNTWTGSAGTAWEDPGNWSCGQVPDGTMSVIIPTGLVNYPVVGFGVTAECFDMSLETGATFTVVDGGSCHIVNP